MTKNIAKCEDCEEVKECLENNMSPYDAPVICEDCNDERVYMKYG